MRIISRNAYLLRADLMGKFSVIMDSADDNIGLSSLPGLSRHLDT